MHSTSPKVTNNSKSIKETNKSDGRTSPLPIALSPHPDKSVHLSSDVLILVHTMSLDEPEDYQQSYSSVDVDVSLLLILSRNIFNEN